MLWAGHWLPVQVQPQPRGLLILRLSLFWVQSPSKGDNRRLRQGGGDGLLACQELLGHLVRTKPTGGSVSVEENNNFQRFGENGFFKIKRGTGHCGVSFVFYQAHLVHNTMFWSESSECIFSFLLRLVHFTIHLPIVQLPKGIIAPLLGKLFYDDSRIIQKEYLFHIFIQHALIERCFHFFPSWGILYMKDFPRGFRVTRIHKFNIAQPVENMREVRPKYLFYFSSILDVAAKNVNRFCFWRIVLD